jgi:trimethylamine:corrinoid methyltransferase-like protein
LGLCEIARSYDLPVNLGGLATRSHSLDAQYGSEAISHGLLAYLARPDEIYGMGLLGDAQILSLEKMVLDHHLANQLEAIVKPVKVDEAHLQANLIEQVGIGGHFLKLRETRDFTRREYTPMWPPVDKIMLDIAHEEALDIFYNHTPPPLPDGADQLIEEILVEADHAITI